jgi:hypothetical protein
MSVWFKSESPNPRDEEAPEAEPDEDAPESYYYDDATGYEKYEETDDDEDD